ncbi:hypothetical protein [Solirubrobacter pauli]|nr:hypothetical protein [Solirubrobacter pauli]
MKGENLGTGLQSLARRSGRTRVDYLDFSGQRWPLAAPALFVANQRWVLDRLVPRELTACALVTPTRYGTHVTATSTADELTAGHSLGFVFGAPLPTRAAALVALTVNPPIIPVVAQGTPDPSARVRPQPRVRVVIGAPFYAETSSIDELVGDIAVVMRHLEDLAVEFSSSR